MITPPRIFGHEMVAENGRRGHWHIALRDGFRIRVSRYDDGRVSASIFFEEHGFGYKVQDSESTDEATSKIEKLILDCIKSAITENRFDSTQAIATFFHSEVRYHGPSDRFTAEYRGVGIEVTKIGDRRFALLITPSGEAVQSQGAVLVKVTADSVREVCREAEAVVLSSFKDVLVRAERRHAESQS